MEAGFTNTEDPGLRGIVWTGATSLELFHPEEKMFAALLPPHELSNKVLDQTEKYYREFTAVACFAQTATIRLLYRGTAIEEEDITEIMALEMTTKLEASKIGIGDDDFSAWHTV